MKLALHQSATHGLVVIDLLTMEIVHGVTEARLSVGSTKDAGGRMGCLEIKLLPARVFEHFTSQGHSTVVRMVDPRSGAERTVKSISWANGDVWSPE